MQEEWRIFKVSEIHAEKKETKNNEKGREERMKCKPIRKND